MGDKNKSNLQGYKKVRKLSCHLDLVPSLLSDVPSPSALRTDTLNTHWLPFSLQDQIAPEGPDSTAACRLQGTPAHLKMR